MAFQPTSALVANLNAQAAAKNQTAQSPQGGFRPTSALVNQLNVQNAAAAQRQQQLTHPSFGRSLAGYGGAVLSGLGEGTRQLVNLPSNVVNAVTHTHAMPTIGKIQTYADRYNLPQHSIIQGLAQTVPSLAAGELALPAKAAEAIPLMSANVAKQAVGSGLYGAAQGADQKDDISHIVGAGAASALLGGLTGKGVESAASFAKPYAKSLSKHVMQPLIDKAFETISPRLENAPSSGTILKNAYQGAQKNAGNWSDLGKAAQGLDEANVPFDNSYYKAQTNNVLDNLKQQAEEDPDTYNPVVKKVEGFLDRAPTNYQSMVAQKTAINKLPTSWGAETGKSSVGLSRSVAGQLGKALDENGDLTAQQSPVGNWFNQMWKQKRQNYAQLSKFKEHPERNVFNADTATKISNGDFGDITKKYLPQKTIDGTTSMQKYTDLVGGHPDIARDALQQEFLKPYMSSGKLNNNTFFNRYSQLSDPQKSYLFTKPQSQYLDAAQQARSLTQKGGVGDQLGTRVIGGTLGSAVAHHAGMTPWGFALGAIGAPAIKKWALSGLSKSFQSPEGVEALTKLATKGVKKRPKLGYAAISPTLAAANAILGKPSS